MRPLRETAGSLRCGGLSLPAWVADGYVHVRLPFAVDLGRLSALLRAHGLALAHGPEELERLGYQGWGERPDTANYYPWWAAPDPAGGTRLAFPPVEYADGPDGPVPVLGPGAAAVVERWLPLLWEARQQARGGGDAGA